MNFNIVLNSNNANILQKTSLFLNLIIIFKYQIYLHIYHIIEVPYVTVYLNVLLFHSFISSLFVFPLFQCRFIVVFIHSFFLVHELKSNVSLKK